MIHLLKAHYLVNFIEECKPPCAEAIFTGGSPWFCCVKIPNNVRILCDPAAGVRFTVIRSNGKGYPEFCISQLR